MADEAQTSLFEFFGSISKVRTIGRCIDLQLKFGKHCAMDKKMKVKFGAATHCSEGLLDCVHVDV